MSWYTQWNAQLTVEVCYLRAGVQKAESFLQGSSRLYGRYNPAEFTVRSKQAIEGLLSSKGATLNIVNKAVHHLCDVCYLVGKCSACSHPLCHRCFAKDDLLQLEQSVPKPQYDDIPDSVQIMILMAQDIMSAC